MRRIIFFAVLTAVLLAGCTEIKSSKNVTGKAVVEGKNKSLTGSGNGFYRVYGRLDGELVMWHTTKEEYYLTNVGDTVDLYHNNVYTIREK